VSGNGAYRDGAADEALALATCAWRGFEFSTLGLPARPLFAPELPAEHSVRHVRRTWTGRTVEYRWRGGGLDIEARTSLPGPLLRARGRTLRLRWCSGAEPGTADDLVDGTRFDSHGLADARGHRLWLANSTVMPVVIAASAPVRRIRVISHMHWEVEFAKPGGALLIAPLLRESDIPRTRERQALWLELATRPPLIAQERFRERDGGVEIECRFPGSRLAPVPAAAALLDGSSGLLAGAQGVDLLATWCGPFRVAKGSISRLRVATGWMDARWEAGRIASDADAGIPEELAYAGDANWEPGTAMDQLLSLRTWAPMLAATAPALRERLTAQLAPPSATELRAGVETIVEPASGRPWARLRQMWDHVGDACYDIDWYNGLALSGLERATACAVPAIASAASKTARACRTERAALAEYFAVFHDWTWCSAWTDPRGWLWNADCAHNGLEGLLAESRLRASEGDAAGSARMRYLAARSAISLAAALVLPHWALTLREQQVRPEACALRLGGMETWSGGSSVVAVTPEETIGTQAFVSWRELTIATVTTRNPYPLAGNFPEWNALLAAHGPGGFATRLRDAWERQPERCRDWIGFYIGDDWQERRARGNQEARVQASVFYHLAPEIAFRRFVLGETPEVIAGRFATPLNLAEQLLLRGAFRLAGSAGRARAGAAQ
jgi:hypothetical protein